MTWPTVVSRHGAEMAAMRAGITNRETIVERVTDALRDGRVSAARPRWLEQRGDSRRGGIYCWDTAGVVYVLVARPDAFVVVTILTSLDAVVAA